MAIEKSAKPAFGTLSGPYLLGAYLAGNAAIYLGERLIGPDAASRWFASGIGLAVAVSCCCLWVVAWIRSQGEPRKVEKMSALFSIGGLIAVVLYFVGSDLILGPAPIARAEQAGVDIRQVLAATWPVVWICSLLPLVCVQWSAASMAKGKGVEASRAEVSAHNGAVTAILLCTLFLVNAIANMKDVDADMSYFRTTSPSEPSRDIVSGLDTDTKAFLFFPKPNEVLEQVLPYFKELESLSPRFKFRVLDRAMEPELAEKYRVSEDGTIVMVWGEKNMHLFVGSEIDRAKRALARLDADFHKTMLRLMRARVETYFVQGHQERGSLKVEGDSRSTIDLMKKFMYNNNLNLRKLGAADGLARKVPADAGLLVWLDPKQPLLTGELDSLKSYLKKGGRMILTLDPESSPGIDELLKFLGVKFSPTKVAHSTALIPITRTPADKYNIVTNRFSSHPSVGTVSEYSESMPVLFSRTGFLEKLPETKNRVDLVVRSMPKSWLDLDGDMNRGDKEDLSAYQLAAAISSKVKDKGKKKDGSGAREMRVMVFADTDLFSDDFIGFRIGAGGHPGNLQLLADAIKWLTEEDVIGGVPIKEEDVEIAHTRDEDIFWFYASVFALPAIIIAAGAATRWGRGRRKKEDR